MSEALIWNEAGDLMAFQNGFWYSIPSGSAPFGTFISWGNDRMTCLDGGMRKLEEAKAIAQEHADAITSALDKEREKLKVAVDALRPFSYLGGDFDALAYHDLEDDVIVFESITAGEMRAAREAIKQIEEGV